MKVEVEIPMEKLSSTIESLFDSLTPEQKMKVFSDVLDKWYSDDHRASRVYVEQAVIARLRKDPDFSYKPEDEIRGSWKFQDEVRRYVGPKTAFLSKVCEEIRNQAEKSAQMMLARDHVMRTLIEKSVDFSLRKMPAHIMSVLADKMVSGFIGREVGFNASNSIATIQREIEDFVFALRSELMFQETIQANSKHED